MFEGFEELLLYSMKIHSCRFTSGNNIQINCR